MTDSKFVRREIKSGLSDSSIIVISGIYWTGGKFECLIASERSSILSFRLLCFSVTSFWSWLCASWVYCWISVVYLSNFYFCNSTLLSSSLMFSRMTWIDSYWLLNSSSKLSSFSGEPLFLRMLRLFSNAIVSICFLAWSRAFWKLLIFFSLRPLTKGFYGERNVPSWWPMMS